jgi:signal peptidase
MTATTEPGRRHPAAPWLRLAVTTIARVILGAVAGFAVWSLALIPFGYRDTVTSSGSMQPNIGIGDVVVARPIDAHTDLVGRVVTAENPAKPGTLLTHRIVRDNHDGTYTTKGDANPDADSTPMPRAAIKGRAFLLVPWVGLPAQWIDTGQYLPLLASLVGLATLGALARDTDGRDRQAGSARLGPRQAGVATLVVTLLAGTAVVVPAAVGRSAAASGTPTSSESPR